MSQVTATGDWRHAADRLDQPDLLLLAWSGSFLFSLFDRGVKPVET